VQTPLETYLREINETALLTAQDERDLAVAIGEGDTRARDRMVRANLRLVVNIARGYTGKDKVACRIGRDGAGRQPESRDDHHAFGWRCGPWH